MNLPLDNQDEWLFLQCVHQINLENHRLETTERTIILGHKYAKCTEDKHVMGYVCIDATTES